jgi:hypothetical protein
MESALIIGIVILLIITIVLARTIYREHINIKELRFRVKTLQLKYNTLKLRRDDLDELKREKDTEWKRLKDEAQEEAEDSFEYQLERAKETEESLICANKDLHDVIAELRNLFAKTQQESASATVKALVPWKKEEING